MFEYRFAGSFLFVCVVVCAYSGSLVVAIHSRKQLRMHMLSQASVVRSSQSCAQPSAICRCQFILTTWVSWYPMTAVYEAHGNILYLGCMAASHDIRLLREHGVRWRQPCLEHKLFAYKGITDLEPFCANDMSEQVIPYAKAEEILLKIDEQLRGGSGLVFCLRGANRSAFVVELYLAMKTNASVDEIDRHVMRLRPIIDIREPERSRKKRPIATVVEYERSLRALTVERTTLVMVSQKEFDIVVQRLQKKRNAELRDMTIEPKAEANAGSAA